MDLEKIDDPRERSALESQISEFGQCPSLLFRGPHPRRDAHSSPVLTVPLLGQAGVLEVKRSGWGGNGDGSDDGGFVVVERDGRASDVEVMLQGEGDFFHGSSGKPDVLPSDLTSRVYPRYAEDRELAASKHLFRSQQRVSQEGSGRSAEIAHFHPPNGLRRVGSASPTSSYSPPSSGLMPGGLTNNVGSSVGALWKRGLAMAGAVGAAAEAAGTRGGLKTFQGWQGTASEGRRDFLRGRNFGSGELMHSASLPPPPSASVSAKSLICM